MLYFDLAIYKEDLLKENEKNLPSFIKNIIYNFKKLTGQALNLKISNKNLIILPKINKRVLKRIDKILRVDVTKNVCISEELKLKENFVNFLNERNINILDGRWLFKYLAENVLEFLCFKTDLIPEIQEISILTNELTKAWSGIDVKSYKALKNLKKESLRDNMTDIELTINQLAELTTKTISQQEKPETFAKSKDVARRGGKVAKNAKDEFEKATGTKIVSSVNATNKKLLNTTPKNEDD